MGVGTHQLTFTKPTSTSTPFDQEIDISGTTDEVPKIFFVWTSGGTESAGTFGDDPSQSFGWSDGTDDSCRSYANEDANADQIAVSQTRDDAVINLFDPADYDTIVARANVKEFTSGKVTLTWTINNAVATVFHCWIVYGDDITNVKVLNQTKSGVGNGGDITFTGAGFQPEFGMIMGGSESGISFGSSQNDGGFWAVGAFRSTSKRFAIVNNGEDASTSDNHGYYRSDRCHINVDEGNGIYNCDYEFTSFDSDGITITVGGGNDDDMPFSLLLVRGGDWDVGTTTVNSGTGNQTINTSNTDTQIQGILLFSPNGNTTGTSDSNTFRSSIGAVGNNGGSTITEGCTWFGDLDNQGNMVTARIQSNARAMIMATENSTHTSSTINNQGNVTTLNASSFVINWATASSGKSMSYITIAGTWTGPQLYERAPAGQTLVISAPVDRIAYDFRTIAATAEVDTDVAALRTTFGVLADSLTIDNPVTRLLTANRSIPQSITLDVAVDRIYYAFRTIAATVESSAAVDRISTFLRSLSETVDIDNPVTRMLSAFRTIGENPSISDLLDYEYIAGVIERTIDDTVEVATDVARIFIANKSLPESITISNPVSRIAYFFRTIGETPIIDSAVDYLRTVPATISETPEIASDVARMLLANPTISATVDLASQVARTLFANRVIPASVQLDDLVEYLRTVTRTLPETPQVDSSVSRFAAMNRSIAASVDVDAAVDRIYLALASIFETLTISNPLTRIYYAFRDASETTQVDSVVDRIFTAVAAITETPIIDSTVDRLATFYREIQQSITVLDTLIVEGGLRFVSLSETVNINALVDREANVTRQLGENVISTAGLTTRSLLFLIKRFITIFRKESQLTFTRG